MVKTADERQQQTGEGRRETGEKTAQFISRLPSPVCRLPLSPVFRLFELTKQFYS